MGLQFFAPRGPKNELVRLPASLRRTVRWLPQIGDVFPDFSVDTTHGPLRFRDWADGHWVHLFSHPAAFTPVCTTEMVSVASCCEAWKENNVKNMALTGSSLDDQRSWHREIEALFGPHIDFPCAHDPDMQLARLFGMMHDRESTAWPVRKSFLIDPALHVRMIFEYPIHVGRNTEEILRVARALQMRAESGAATPADWCGGDTVIIPDNRPEYEVLRDFGARSVKLMPYLRVVSPSQKPSGRRTGVTTAGGAAPKADARACPSPTCTRR